MSLRVHRIQPIIVFSLSQLKETVKHCKIRQIDYFYTLNTTVGVNAERSFLCNLTAVDIHIKDQ